MIFSMCVVYWKSICAGFKLHFHLRTNYQTETERDRERQRERDEQCDAFNVPTELICGINTCAYKKENNSKRSEEKRRKRNLKNQQ